MSCVFMGSDKTQIGSRVDRDTWERFKSFVERRHGRVRGVLSNEVEAALEAHMSGEYPADRLARIENDVATIKANLAAEADGGEVAVADPPTPPSRGVAHTHAHPDNIALASGAEVDVDADDPTEPGRKAPKADKADWLFQDMATGGGLVVNPKAVEKRIARTWGFGNRATADLIEVLYRRYNAVPVRKSDGDPWQVALGETDADREAAIDDWCGGGEYQYVNRDKVDTIADFLHT